MKSQPKSNRPGSPSLPPQRRSERPGAESAPPGGNGAVHRLDPLARAVSAWTEQGNASPLERWLDQTVDGDGIPLRLPIQAWRDVLERFAHARDSRPDDWPEPLDMRVEPFFRNVLRFSRPDGSAVFGPPGRDLRTKRLFRALAERLSDAGLATVVGWWFPEASRSTGYAPPPLPAYARPDRPLAMLRADWSKAGDLLAIDHRETGPCSAVELAGLGRTWLGPTWSAESSDAAASRSRVRLWISNPMADLFEWSFRSGALRIDRTAVLLRGRRLALLGDQVEGTAEVAGIRLQVPAEVEPRPIDQSRGLALARPAPARGVCQVLPVGLPSLPYETERGLFAADGHSLRLVQRIEGRRAWLPLLASWDPIRNRRPVRWRALTVSEKSKACAPDVAFAVRVSWGRDDTLVIYRSLGRPALRAFLGHQTRARFFVGVFEPSGDVRPIVTVSE